jgi:hypothetical protein
MKLQPLELKGNLEDFRIPVDFYGVKNDWVSITFQIENEASARSMFEPALGRSGTSAADGQSAIS